MNKIINWLFMNDNKQRNDITEIFHLYLIGVVGCTILLSIGIPIAILIMEVLK